jgi:hypothetical protein
LDLTIGVLLRKWTTVDERADPEIRETNGSDHDKADNDAWSDAHDGQQPTAITQRPMFPDGRLSRKGGYGKVVAMHGA